jgi:hypothetical protein
MNKLCSHNGGIILLFLGNLRGMDDRLDWLCLGVAALRVWALGVHLWSYDQIIIIPFGLYDYKATIKCQAEVLSMARSL